MGTVTRYESVKHLDMLKTWLLAFSLPVPAPSYLPKYGLLVDGIAIAFLVRTDSGQAYIDYLITDPKSEKLTRDRAVKTLFLALEEQAAFEGYQLVTTLVQLPSQRDRVKRLGYQAHGEYSLFYKVPGDTKCLG